MLLTETKEIRKIIMNVEFILCEIKMVNRDGIKLVKRLFGDNYEHVYNSIKEDDIKLPEDELSQLKTYLKDLEQLVEFNKQIMKDLERL